ncbi:MAG: hypothetical protein WKF87_04965 [Chryseolinea sp.]
MTQIAGLHIGYFFRLVLLANCVALPVAYWITKAWLNEFAYRVDLTTLPFLAVSGISLLIVFVSGSYSAWKAARMNPMEVIKINARIKMNWQGRKSINSQRS